MKLVGLVNLGGVPVDRGALRVTMPGEHYEPGNYKGIGKGAVVFDVMPPLAEIGERPESQKDLTGVRNGRLVVVAYFGRSKWICRCDCGKYTIRKGRSMLRPKYDGDMCVVCERWRKIKNQEFFDRTGKWPDQVAVKA